jgi:hypothetical protein
MSDFEHLLSVMFESIESLNEGWRDVYKQFVESKKVPLDVFNKFKEADPSETKKYLQWMCKQYVVNPKNENKIIQSVKEFHMDVSKGFIKGQDSDISKYDLDSLSKQIQSNSGKKSKSQIRAENKSNTKIIQDDDTILAIAPLNREAAIQYGKGTKWCISSKMTCKHWKDYMKDGAWFVFVIFKKDISVGKYSESEVHKKFLTFDKLKDGISKDNALRIYHKFKGNIRADFYRGEKFAIGIDPHDGVFLYDEWDEPPSRAKSIQLKNLINSKMLKKMKNPIKGQ